jgi:site-specific DNA-cytosine methylase
MKDVSAFFLGKLPTEQRHQLDAAVTLATSEGRSLRVGTACSGTDSPVAVFNGLAKAMPRLQIEHTFSCEFDAKKREWITDNFPDLPYLFGDIQELPTGTAFNYITGKAEEVPSVDILIAGFVCKSVSFENNDRDKYANCIKEACGLTGITFQGMIQYVRKFQPAVVICENVEGLVKKNRGLEPVVHHVKDEFASSGYAFQHKVLDSRDFLLPHRRKRCWMWAFRGCSTRARRRSPAKTCWPSVRRGTGR